MTIEGLYPELGSLYGENGNLRYLQASCPEATVLRTANSEEPAFVREPVALLCVGAMSEEGQTLAIRRLSPYKEALRQRIEDGMAVLATGNAMELFGQSISDGSETIQALGLFPFDARRDFYHRHNSMFLGQFEDMKIVGYKSQFSSATLWREQPFCRVLGGYGTDLKSDWEGVRYKNFFGTYLLGPLLPLNPLFTQYLLRLLGSAARPAFFDEAMEAYQYRLRGLEAPGVRFLVGEHG